MLSDFRPTGRISPKNAIGLYYFFPGFSTLKLINSTISRFIATKVSDQPVSISPAAVSDSSDPVRIILPFKDRSSTDIVRRQLQDLSNKIHTTVSPVFVSQKIERDLKMREAKLPLVNQQCLVYKINLNLTCAMQLMLVTHLATYTCELRNTKAQVYPSAITFVLNILKFLKVREGSFNA